MAEKVEYKSLYILKALCSFFVVFIHLPSFCGEEKLLLPLLRIAVPIFFINSGYFLYMADEVKFREKCKKQFLKLFKICIKSSFIVSFVSWGMHLLRDDVYWQTKWFSLSFWMRWLLVGDNICYPFWYLTAYLHVLIFLLLASKYRMVNYLYIFVPFLCMISIAMNRYSFVFTDIVMDTIISRNSIFCGLPCVLMGMWVRKNSHKIYFKNGVMILMIVVAYIESFILGFLDINGSGADFNLTTYPLAILLFIFCVKNPNLDSRFRYSEILNLIGRKYSLDIYLYHALIYALLLTFCSQLPFRSFFLNAECVILCCMLLSTILNFKMNFLKGKI